MDDSYSFNIPNENGTGSVCWCQCQPVGNMLESWSPIPTNLEHRWPVFIKTLVKTKKLYLGLIISHLLKVFKMYQIWKLLYFLSLTRKIGQSVVFSSFYLNLLETDRIDHNHNSVWSVCNKATGAPVNGSSVGRMAEPGDGSQDDLWNRGSLIFGFDKFRRHIVRNFALIVDVCRFHRVKRSWFQLMTAWKVKTRKHLSVVTNEIGAFRNWVYSVKGFYLICDKFGQQFCQVCL